MSIKDQIEKDPKKPGFGPLHFLKYVPVVQQIFKTLKRTNDGPTLINV